MTRRKTNEDLQDYINLIYVSSLPRTGSVQMVRGVRRHITESKSFIILINTKQSFVNHTSIKPRNASMENAVHLPTLKLKYLQNCWTYLKETSTFICSISRLFGVLTMKLIIDEKCVCLLTTGKITEGSLSLASTQKNNVEIGVLKNK